MSKMLSVCLAPLTAAILVLTGFNANAAKDNKIGYKCHFEMIGGEKMVQHIMSPLGNALLLQGHMQGKYLFGKDGVTKKYVFRVFECVEAKASFRSEDAQALDKRTLL